MFSLLVENESQSLGRPRVHGPQSDCQIFFIENRGSLGREGLLVGAERVRPSVT